MDADPVPGDVIVVEQRSGIDEAMSHDFPVFARAENIARVLDAAELIAAREASMAAALAAGKPIVEVMDATYEHMLKE